MLREKGDGVMFADEKLSVVSARFPLPALNAQADLAEKHGLKHCCFVLIPGLCVMDWYNHIIRWSRAKNKENQAQFTKPPPLNDIVGEFGFHAQNITNSSSKRAWFLNSPTIS